MKRFFLIASFLLLMAGLSATAYAQAKPCQPGCDCTSPGGGVLGKMENHADAMRVRDKAYAQETIKQNDNALGMTCYDRALGLTSRLGTIFSDVAPDGIVPENRDVWGGMSTYPQAGMDKVLANALNEVVAPSMREHAENFESSLSGAFLGATALGFMGVLTGQLNSLISGFMVPIGTVGSAFNTVNNYVQQFSSAWNAVQGIINTLGVGGGAFGAIAGIINQILGAWNTVSTLFAQAVNAIRGLANTFSNAINSIIANTGVGTLNGMLSQKGSPTDPCARISNLWSTATVPPINPNDPDGFQTIVGTGIEQGTPYFTFNELLNGGPAGNTIGTDLRQALTNDTPLLQKALQDVTTNGLQGPGAMPSWPSTPAISAGASTGDIIACMRTGC